MFYRGLDLRYQKEIPQFFVCLGVLEKTLGHMCFRLWRNNRMRHGTSQHAGNFREANLDLKHAGSHARFYRTTSLSHTAVVAKPGSSLSLKQGT